MGNLIALKEMKIRARGESYFTTYPIGSKFTLLGYTDESPRPLYARIILPNGKKWVVTLYENTWLDDWTPRFRWEK